MTPLAHHRTRTLAVALALPLTAGLAVACATNPVTGRSQLALISVDQEIAMGREAHQQVLQTIGAYEDPELQRYVDRIGQRLAAASERPDLPWTFTVVDDPSVNAFALPGGFIYLTRGILTHMESEAEMVSVLGHEIGHVTARHSVEQISRAQLAQIGLVAGMVVSPELRNYGDLASTGLQVMFLKFSRDDERQADALGLRYMNQAGYEAREMVEMFRTLERVSEGSSGGRLPDWLATHPNPENRLERIQQSIAATAPEMLGHTVDRNPFLRQVDGIAFGPDPREGYFVGNAFYHPELAFSLRFPQGWRTSNQKQAVGAISPGEDAVVVLTLAEGSSPREAAQRFFSQPWGTIAWAIFIIGWLIPFSYLLKRLTGRPPERHQVFKVILFFGWIAIFFERMLLVFPSLLRDNTVPLGPVEILVTLGFFALFVLSRNWFLAHYKPVLSLPK